MDFSSYVLNKIFSIYCVAVWKKSTEKAFQKKQKKKRILPKNLG